MCIRRLDRELDEIFTELTELSIALGEVVKEVHRSGRKLQLV